MHLQMNELYFILPPLPMESREPLYPAFVAETDSDLLRFEVFRMQIPLITLREESR